MLAEVGPFTALIESLATAVGAGVVLCSVAAGISGLAQGLPRSELESGTLMAGYVGGGFGAAIAVVDLILRYGFSK